LTKDERRVIGSLGVTLSSVAKADDRPVTKDHGSNAGGLNSSNRRVMNRRLMRYWRV
jgi:hypothetical protein